MKKSAQEEIQNERERVMAQMKREVVSLSLAAAGKLIAKNLDTAESEKLIGDFIEELDKEKIGDLPC